MLSVCRPIRSPQVFTGQRLYDRSAERHTSGRLSPTTAQHVWEDLQGKIEVLLDGGPVGIGIESTIVDLSEDQPMIFDRALLPRRCYLRSWGRSVWIRALHRKTARSRQRHRACVTAIMHQRQTLPWSRTYGSVIAKIDALTGEAQVKGQSVGVLATAENQDAYIADRVIVIGQREDEAEIARHLFDVLRQFDTLGVDVIYSESFAAAGVGQAIVNRLLKAAGHKRIFCIKGTFWEKK